MSRIGELLLEHGWVDQTNLKRALSEQSLTGGRRLCSLLIARGLLDPDHAARALGEQHEVPAVLQRHLEFRERALAAKLPAAIARAQVALPIGHTRGGELIVCVRDPSPEVEAVIKGVIEGPVVIAVAPASQLEQLIEEAYALEDDANEFDVDLSTGTQIEPPPRNGDELSMSDIGSYSLVELDDLRVTKDHSQTISMPARTTPPPFATVTPAHGSAAPVRSTLPPATRRAPTSPFSSITPPFATATPPEPAPIVEPMSEPIATLELDPDLAPEDIPPPPPPHKPPATPPLPTPALGTQPPRLPSPSKVMIPPLGAPLPRPTKTPTSPQSPVKLTIDGAKVAIADALSRDTATDVAMRYALQRWNASLLLAVKEGAALGHRGHGTQLSADAVRAVAIPLSSPSIVKVAHDTKELATEPPPNVGAIHERLLRLLGSPRKAIAAPIFIAGRIACVIVVGDPIGHGDSAGDLDELAIALGEAYTRILRDMK